MKYITTIILSLIIAAALYIPCRNLAVKERGNNAIGGEILIPAGVMLAATCFICDEKGGAE